MHNPNSVAADLQGQQVKGQVVPWNEMSVGAIGTKKYFQKDGKIGFGRGYWPRRGQSSRGQCHRCVGGCVDGVWERMSWSPVNWLVCPGNVTRWIHHFTVLTSLAASSARARSTRLATQTDAIQRSEWSWNISRQTAARLVNSRDREKWMHHTALSWLGWLKLWNPTHGREASCL